jgi:GDP/UDP-N,N'-diacetylbacillosamine 2-epimerase (hydrolysing)
LAVTGTRADFGLMRSTYALIAKDPRLQLSLLVTGMHLDATHGRTVDEVRATGWRIAAQVAVDTASRTPLAMAQGIGTMLSGMANVLARESPDLLLVLGDRGEMLAAAIAALHLGVPCVHVHGGERSGTVDDSVRHAISKLASWHLVATEESRERLLRMGEAPQRVHVVGAPGLDGLAALGAMALEAAWPTSCRGGPALRFALVVFHPVVQQAAQAAEQALALSDALCDLGLPLVWLAPNSDAGSADVASALAKAQAAWPTGSCLVTHVERAQFVSLMRHAAVMAGNSSAGIIEAASFGTPVVNIGDRQNLRERNSNVIDTPAQLDAIRTALRRALATPRLGAAETRNRFGDGRAGPRIVEQLATLPLVGLTEKTHEL